MQDRSCKRGVLCQKPRGIENFFGDEGTSSDGSTGLGPRTVRCLCRSAFGAGYRWGWKVTWRKDEEFRHREKRFAADGSRLFAKYFNFLCIRRQNFPLQFIWARSGQEQNFAPGTVPDGFKQRIKEKEISTRKARFFGAGLGDGEGEVVG